MSAKVTSNNIELVDVSSSQELTNKTIDASLNDITNLPPSPAEWGSISGDIEDQSDLNAILITQDEAIVDITNKINPYITNPNALFDVSPWIVYQNTAQSTPVDGTGGTPTGSLTLTRDTTSKVIGTTSFLLEQAAFNSQGQGASCDFTIDNALKNSPLQITLKYNAVGPMVFGENSDVRVFIYDIDNAQLITPAYNTLDGSGSYKCTFQSTSSLNYRLILHVATTNTSGWQLFFGQVEVKESEDVWFPAISDMENTGPIAIGATTTAPTKGTTTSDVLFLSRSGDKANIVGYFQGSFSNAGSGDYLFSLPYNLKFDANKTKFYTGGAATFGAYATYGIGKASLSTVPDNTTYSGQGVIVPYDATRFRIGLSVESSTAYANAGFLGSSFWGGLPGSTITFDFSAPIQGWTSGNKTIGDIAVNVPVNVYAEKTSGSFSANADIGSWTSKIDDLNTFNLTTGLFTAPFTKRYRFIFTLHTTAANVGSAYIHAPRQGNANSTGATRVTAVAEIFLNKGETVSFRNSTALTSSTDTRIYISSIDGGDIFRTFNRSTTKYLASNITSNTTDIASLRFTNLIVGKLYDLDMTGLGVSLDPGTNNQLVITAVHDGGNLTRSIFRNDSASVSSLRKGGRAIFTATATTITFNATFTGSGNLFGDGTAWGSTVVLTELNNTVEGNF